MAQGKEENFQVLNYWAFAVSIQQQILYMKRLRSLYLGLAGHLTYQMGICLCFHKRSKNDIKQPF